MTKAELVGQIAEQAGLTKTQAERFLEAVMGCVEKEVKNGGKITLTGLGTFSLAERKARKGRNPRTGEETTIPARKVVKFKTSKSLNDAVN